MGHSRRENIQPFVHFVLSLRRDHAWRRSKSRPSLIPKHCRISRRRTICHLSFVMDFSILKIRYLIRRTLFDSKNVICIDNSEESQWMTRWMKCRRDPIYWMVDLFIIYIRYIISNDIRCCFGLLILTINVADNLNGFAANLLFDESGTKPMAASCIDFRMQYCEWSSRK